MNNSETSASVIELLEALDRIDLIDNEAWLATLEHRKVQELSFHDKDRDQSFVENSIANDTYEKFYGNKKYYRMTYRSKSYIERWIKDSCKDGGVFLDYACGNGANAIAAAQSGASLAIGLDISSVSVNNARNTAHKLNLTNIRFVQADAENTKLPDNSIDYIICNGMLHHLDLSFAFPELRRILKPGGKILCIEALDYNPLIKIYRAVTPAMRTEWEAAHILSLKDITFARRFFIVSEIRFWHIIGYLGAKLPIAASALDKLDTLLEKTPLINLWGWIFTFELSKSKIGI